MVLWGLIILNFNLIPTKLPARYGAWHHPNSVEKNMAPKHESASGAIEMLFIIIC